MGLRVGAGALAALNVVPAVRAAVKTESQEKKQDNSLFSQKSQTQWKNLFDHY